MTKLRTRGKATAATAVALTAALMIPGAAMAHAQEEGPADTSHLTVLYFNDFHGRIDNYNDLTVGFASKIEELRAAAGEENTVLLSGGDSIGGTLFNSSAQIDNPAIDVLNAIELDASAVGNHEFDRGIDDLEGRVADRKDFPYLAANVTYNGAPVADGGVTFFERAGVRVAVIGAVTEETPGLVDQNGIQGVEFTNPVDAVNEIAAGLKDGDESNGEADIVIATFHEGATVQLAANAPQEDQATALQTAMSEQAAFDEIVNGTHANVDVILNGHTHKMYNWLAPVPGTDGETRPVLQSGEYAANIGQVPLVIDNATGEVTVDVEGFGLYPTEGTEIPEGNARVDAVAAIVDEALAAADEIGSQPIGSLDADITTAFTGGDEVDGVYAGGDRDDRSNASTMGTLVANMYRDVLSSEQRGGADIGLVNPGGLRADFVVENTEDGVLTVRDAVSVLPFANSLFTTTLTGAQLKQTLEEQWQPDGSSRPYLQLGLSDNVRYTYDSTRERNDRITSIWVDGELVTADQEIRVAIPSFLTSGTGDNFFTLGDGADTRDGGIVDSDGFMDHVEQNSPLAPDFARSQLDIVSLPESAVEAGTEVAFTVNKVNLTSQGAPQDTVLSVYYGDELVGEAAIEANSAEVAFTVPQPAGDDQSVETFSLRTASGTEIPFQLEVIPAEEPVEPTPTEEPTEEPSPSAPTPSDGEGGDGELPRTGGELPFALLTLAMLALVAGAAFQLRARRS